MERNLYFENYINNLQKDVFLIAANSNYDVFSFIETYMKGDVRRNMDKPFSSWHNQPANRIFEETTASLKQKTNTNNLLNTEAVEWLGFFYSKWHFITGESSKTIVRYLPPKDGLKNFYTLHQLNEKEAIEICKRHYNLSRNNHRNYEVKNSKEHYSAYNDLNYYSFLAVRMLYKLLKDESLNDLEYVKDDNEYDFVDNKYSLGINGTAIFRDSIINEFEKYNDRMGRYSRKAQKSIFFSFVFSSYYELDDLGEEKLLVDIEEIKKRYPPNKRKYNYLYFYMLGRLYEINSANELYIYSLPFSKRERMGIINKMRNYGLNPICSKSAN